MEDPLIVQAPMKPRADITIDIPRVDWKFSPEACPRLLVREDDRLITLPPAYVRGTGIGRPGKALILYRRPPLVKQWNEMTRCSIQTYARLWIVGPPGAGKSCTALAFVWSLDRFHWDVIWIHYSGIDRLFHCVWLRDDKKAVCVLKEETIARDLEAILSATSPTRRTIVVLDGYVEQSAAVEAAHLKCLRWHQRDKIKHRLVCVCSTVTAGKDYRPELYHRIPTNVDDELRNSGMEIETSELHRVTQAMGRLPDPVKTMMCFELASWRFRDYKEAILIDDFFRNVMAVFPRYASRSDPDEEAAERIKLLQEKYFVAGASVRLMFDVTTATAIEVLGKLIAEAPNIESFLQGFVGESSSGAVNLLFARYYDWPHNHDVRLASQYVVRRFATEWVRYLPRSSREFAT